jgi:hypothetical protein
MMIQMVIIRFYKVMMALLWSLKRTCLLLNMIWVRIGYARVFFFFSICIIKDKVCDLIIGSDSYDNVVSFDMVEKLQLKIEEHLNLYKLKWLNRDSKIIMDEHCLVLYRKLIF